MQRLGLLVVASIVATPALYPVVHACGDKFLLVGRGAKFQRAYASVYRRRYTSSRGRRPIPRPPFGTRSCTRRCARPATP